MTPAAPATHRHPASFRDPSGFTFWREGTLYRHVAPSYAPHLEALHASGLYERLADSGRLVRHRRATLPGYEAAAYAILEPDRVPFVSYPYEWCFSAHREAALLTVALAELSLDHGMILKDASAYNVQFEGTRPVFIDTLSFELYSEGRPWVAYRQFCEQLLAPLAVMAYGDPRLGAALRAYPEGFPLDLSTRLLPARSWLRPGLLLHLHLHARSARAAGKRLGGRQPRVSQAALRGILESLGRTVKRLPQPKAKSEWLDYTHTCSYTAQARDTKRDLVTRMASASSPGLVWDLGANTGELSEAVAAGGAHVVAFDQDAVVVDAAYRRLRRSRSESVQPLVMDLGNPSPGLGWAGRERDSLAGRGPAGLVLALAVVHHLAIGRNVPLDQIVGWLGSLGDGLIVEFVPKSDVQVQRMLSTRADVFPDYSEESFEQQLRRHFAVEERVVPPGSERPLYRCRRRI